MAGGKAVRFSTPVKPPTKPSKGKALATDSSKTDASSHESGLPLARYTSIVGTQSLLLAFTALFLPRSTTSLLGSDFLPPPSSSLDRPQHPFLEPITASPVLTLVWLCLGVGVVISWSSGYMRVWVKGETSSRAGNQEDVKSSSLATGKSKAIMDSYKATALSIPIFHLFIVLFGAPLTSHIPQTLLLSTLLSLLTFYPSTYALGLPSLTSTSSAAQAERLQYVRLFSELFTRTHVERALVFPVIGTVVGCWLGAFVLPLDWDRPWQAWPLVPAYGSIFGYVVGSLVSVTFSSVKSLADLDKAK
ncbi:hypothetical protein M407DRAFT_241161 [Tulasnella calospora MUT 4182]|uniref:Glycosylphosphatidylinositol anchor biosynthesis protein 11 n=1 Tax=Tulasnella calospora MUT 4182 TaxID=1051891 RepID=A0A0C3MHE8_9AGAM|nr:hypothetical protein M407DRAFT_241161 [Tulasnella calospora MUT 4182]